VRPATAADPSLKLGAGESEAIALALELRADALLLDGRKARLEPQKRGLITLRDSCKQRGKK
jgi:predicted nucleic acid-binding protein